MKNDTDNLINLTESILINRTLQDAETALEFNWFKDELEGGSKYKKSRTIKRKKRKGSKKGNKKKTKKNLLVLPKQYIGLHRPERKMIQNIRIYRKGLNKPKKL